VNTKLSGSMVAIVTPMKNGKIDYQSLETLYKIHAAAGTDAVVICGTTGESATMTHAEHREMIAHAAEFFQSELSGSATSLIAGTGSNSTHEAVSLTEFAVERGVGVVLVITPYYNKPTPRGQMIHYTEVARAAGKAQVIPYNVPSRTGLKMTLETILDLAEVENITGIKEASGDLILISEIVRRAPSRFAVLSGEDNLTFPMMALGATGVISVTANLVPTDIKKMIDLCLADQFTEARAYHQKVFCLTEALFCETNPIPVKTGLNLMAGTPAPGGGTWPSGGELRLPMCEMRPEALARLKREMEVLGLVSKAEVTLR
jgi:4-hydroxy-tetrahydrodipicolinate synthase